MLKDDSEPRKDLTPEELFEQALPLLDGAVRAAFLRYRHRPTPEDVKRLRQRLIVILRDNDLKLLRDYRGEAGLKTWLQTLANRHVSDFLQVERRKVCLDELSDGYFIVPPTQEDEVWEEEERELLKKAVKRLTKRQRLWYWLLFESGLSESEIAQKMGVKVETVYQAKSRLIKKSCCAFGFNKFYVQDKSLITLFQIVTSKCSKFVTKRHKILSPSRKMLLGG